MEPKNKVAVVIPFYRNEIDHFERISLKQCEKILGLHTKIAIKPKSLNLSGLDTDINFQNTISFDDEYFENISGYNRLMLSADFYSQFSDFEFILIYQMDCFVFKDDLENWCNKNWDYIGAPWIKKTYNKSILQIKLAKLLERFKKPANLSIDSHCSKSFLNKVGNGGFSLRRVVKFKNICSLMKDKIDFYNSQNSNLYNEDVFWSIEVNKEKHHLNIPDVNTALKFAFEVPAVKHSKLNKNNIPFGCHDWDKYLKYWRPIFKSFGYNV